ncbi:FAS1-like dehydratase domain-containing protein [Kineococcus indalonis]|uniref:FAS1-like dehydratase domain-containing protein n=1 Tax=Kineococcus indalonis TaxID=2696566 RepID=UPI00141369FA|nr:MaoC family dehydratase N-terminal domain-containing protein [Kineococcus indalonis]NAZ85929.1 MaoC family dehydratase [Kineococcus indalonis]
MTSVTVDESFQGRVYPASGTTAVTAGAVRAFARAVRAVHPAHHDTAAARALGHADVVAPPTFAVTLAQRADAQFVTDPAAGIDYSRVVHGEQSFTHHRPIVAGDELTAELHVDRVRVVRGNAMVTTRTELRLTDGTPVCTAVSTLVVRAPEEQ